MEVTNKSALARELGVSRSSLYYRPKKPDKDEALRREIERVMRKNPGYGSPRVAIALKINEKTLVSYPENLRINNEILRTIFL